MDSDNRSHHRSRRSAIAPLIALAIVFFDTCLLGCAHSDPRRFRLAPPVLRDQDLDLVAVACHSDPTPAEPDRKVCAPEDYESSFSWDAADNSIFRPIAKFFEVDEMGESVNVNAFDEVPDSSWFTNRIGASPAASSLTPEDAARGYCPEGYELTSDPPEGSWTIDHGKDNGANPGFRVNVNGTKFMLKTDDEVLERATGATAIASRLSYAAGWWAPCDAVVYFKRAALRLKPGLTVKANVGGAKPFDEEMLTKTLSKTARRGDLYRATASRWLPGKTLGPFTYEGRKGDDPSDVIPHENRRDLRGARVIAAWLNHFDSREQNSMSTWMPLNPNDPKSMGYVRHWYIDLGDCFGSEWAIDGFSRRLGFSYIFDTPHILGDFATFGALERPWDRVTRTPGQEIFGYFSARDFDPDTWHGEYPNPAFGRMTERDAAWAARIIARFTPAHIEAAVRVGDFTDPAHTRYLADVLVARQRIVLRRYFAKLSPLTDVRVKDGALCASDLARKTGVYDAASFRYSASVSKGGGAEEPLAVSAENDGNVCVALVANAPATGLADDAIARYRVVRIANGVTPGPLVIHLYDLGAGRGLRVVGIERPSH